jgi:hypothetical protein
MHFAGEGGCYGVLSDGKLRLFLLAEAPTFLSFFAFSGWGSFISPIKFRRRLAAAAALGTLLQPLRFVL